MGDEPKASNDMILGEMRGQLREVVHTLNNVSTKVDALGREVFALGPLASDMSEIKTRLVKLEETGNQQSGGLKVVSAILNSPVIMLVVMLAGLVWAIITGRLRP